MLLTINLGLDTSPCNDFRKHARGGSGFTFATRGEFLTVYGCNSTDKHRSKITGNRFAAGIRFQKGENLLPVTGKFMTFRARGSDSPMGGEKIFPHSGYRPSKKRRKFSVICRHLCLLCFGGLFTVLTTCAWIATITRIHDIDVSSSVLTDLQRRRKPTVLNQKLQTNATEL